jgi:hypothetical protein
VVTTDVVPVLYREKARTFVNFLLTMVSNGHEFNQIASPQYMHFWRHIVSYIKRATKKIGSFGNVKIRISRKLKASVGTTTFFVMAQLEIVDYQLIVNFIEENFFITHNDFQLGPSSGCPDSD